jgi:VIT1/CCC1 family predicted Fe2+/Mn2+ transporter
MKTIAKFQNIHLLHLILLIILKGLVAGALSMALGEYVSVASQLDSEDADMQREKAEFLKSEKHAARYDMVVLRI